MTTTLQIKYEMDYANECTPWNDITWPTMIIIKLDSLR